MLGQMIWGGVSGGTYLVTILFTGLVIGAGTFALSVMPRWQDKERARTRAEEAARAAKPTPVVELRKAA